MAKIEPFMVKPDSNLFGLSNYYNIISEPMWLDEGKFFNLLTKVVKFNF